MRFEFITTFVLPLALFLFSKKCQHLFCSVLVGRWSLFVRLFRTSLSRFNGCSLVVIGCSLVVNGCSLIIVNTARCSFHLLYCCSLVVVGRRQRRVISSFFFLFLPSPCQVIKSKLISLVSSLLKMLNCVIILFSFSLSLFLSLVARDR